jgi:hypothetical protein
MKGGETKVRPIRVPGGKNYNAKIPSPFPPAMGCNPRVKGGSMSMHDIEPPIECEFWTVERTNRLLQMRLEGYPMSTIGAVLGKSRNAIAGKISRLQNAGVHVNSPGHNKGCKDGKVSLPPRARLPEFRSSVKFGEPLPFLKISNDHCKYIVSTDGPAMCCGNPNRKGSPYCEGHHAACYDKPAQFRRA